MKLKRILLYTLIVGLASSCSVQKNLIPVMTFNVRLDVAVDGENQWPNRVSAVEKMLDNYPADFIGTQEVLHSQLTDLLRMLPNHRHVGVARTDGQMKGEYSPLLYRYDKYRLLDSGTFWLSETPGVVGSKGWDAALERIASWGLFQQIATGRKIAVFNTHFDHIGQRAREESVTLIKRKMHELTPGVPAVLLGDFNIKEDNPALKRVTEDAFLGESRSLAKRTEGPVVTFNGFGKVPETEWQRLDYVFVTRDFEVIEYETITDKYPSWVSDHFPVRVVLKW